MDERDERDAQILAAAAQVLQDVVAMRRQMDQVEHNAIALVRAAGLSWDDIGDELGVSRQAVRQRFNKIRQRQSPRAD